MSGANDDAQPEPDGLLMGVPAERRITAHRRGI
jgi:hypothetical protein